jgi:amino acid adenylation domain-containing protein
MATHPTAMENADSVSSSLRCSKNAEKGLVEWNAATIIPLRDAFVPELVSARAQGAPEALAVVAESEALTYGELNSRANQLAHHLRLLGVGPEVVVGLCVERSLDFVVAALGIMKSGGAYLPLDPATPKARIASILSDSQVSVLITGHSMAESLAAGNWRVLAMDTDWPVIARHPSESPTAEALRGEDLAYVIYTSGSTGEPKGVEITHASLSNLIFWHRNAFGVTPADRATQLASPGFDAAVWEIWPYLTAGASVHIPDKFTIAVPAALRDWLLSQQITISFAPTALAEQLMTLAWPQDTSVRLLLTGADVLRHYPPTNLPFTVVNNYGPTECTVVATSAPVLSCEQPDHLPPVGRPIANTQIYILDEKQQQVPPGVAGELHITGIGLARGYRNRPELTAQKFVANPFGLEPNSRLYKTGDLACSLPDGQISFVGRIDEQVKIRGFRVEPNEIAAALDKHSAVEASLVMRREDVSGDSRLVAYIVPKPESQVTASELRIFLGLTLPTYMVPSSFVRVDSFSLTANGKIDRGALPQPNACNTIREQVHVAPRTLVEERLSVILRTLLHLEDVSVEDNFFMLGGHSLLGAQLIARIRDAFGVEISLRALFNNPTVAGISTEIEQLILAKLKIARCEAGQASTLHMSTAGDRW